MKRAEHGPRIALVGAFQHNNYGDQLFPVLFRREMEQRLPGLAVTLFAPTAGHCRESDQPVHAIQEMPQLFPHGPDAIVVGGGDLIRLDLMADVYPRWDTYLPSAQMWLLPALWARSWGVPVLWNGVGVPHAFTAEQAPLVQQACRATDYLAVRDPLSRELLVQAGVDQAIAVVPDTGVNIAELFTEEELRAAWQAFTGRPADPAATLCVQVSPALLGDDHGLWINQIKRVLAKRFQRVLLLPICNWQGDQEILTLLHDHLAQQVDLVRGPTRAVQVAAAIWGSGAFVGSSLHGCLTALSYHKPHVAVGPLAKLRGHFRMVGLPQCALTSWSQLAESWHWLTPEHSRRFRRVREQLSRQVSRHFDELARQTAEAIRRKKQTGGLRLARTELDWNTLQELTVRTCAREAAQACQTMSQLGVQLATARLKLMKHEAFDRQFGVHCLQAAYPVLRKAPFLYQCLVAAITGCLRLRHLMIQSKNIAGILVRQATQDPVLSGLLRGNRRLWARLSDVAAYLRERLFMVDDGEPVEPAVWFRNHRIGKRQLRQFRRQRWPAYAPRFTVVLRLVNEAADHLEDSLASLAQQTYPNWRLLAAAPAPLSAQVSQVLEDFAQEHGPFPILEQPDAPALEGDYLCFLDHGDVLEPHALHRFAEAVLSGNPDLLYSDEVETTHNLEEIIAVAARPAFSYDHYLTRTYFSHLLGVRADRVVAAGGLGEACRYGQNVDLVLRVLEHSETVSHLADVLYRQRRGAGYSKVPAPDEQARLDKAAVEQHLCRLGLPARVHATAVWDCRDVRFEAHGGRVAIIIPTKNQLQLLSQCVDSLRATLPPQADILVLDHESDDPGTLAYLAELPPAILVRGYQGPFNFSAMMNQAVAALDRPYDHYLFLNNDTEALAPGWLEHMLGLAQREEVGAVGALLLYPDGRVQHAGVMVGMHFAADHTPKYVPAYAADGTRLPGPQASLATVRDQSALTGACLLVRADAFRQVGGFDERFAVGFGDTDLCLRLRAHGYKVLFDPHAVLRHHESATRGKLGIDPHPVDTLRFRERYLDQILNGDPFHCPMHSRYSGTLLERPSAAWWRKAWIRTEPVNLAVHAIPAAIPGKARAA